MVLRILSYLAFVVVMAVSIALSTVIVICLYLPFVVLKAAFLAVTGKIRADAGASASQSAQHG